MNMNENNEKKDFSLLKNFIMKLILIIIFILMLIKFVPWPDMSGIAPLQEQIFNSNITTMKEAAIAYYTTERLPLNVGDKKTLTLENMLELKLLVPLVDKNGNTCDVKESYVSIEKVDEDEYNYKMKVNLKCSDKEDYIYVYLGCYSYCEGIVCEKQEDPKPPASSKPTKPIKPSNKPQPTKNPKPTYSPKPTPSESPDPTPTDSPKPTDKPKPTPTPTPTNKPNKEYEYKYKKTTNTQYSAWTGWKVWSYTDNNKVNWNNTATYQIEDLGTKKVQVGTRVNTGTSTRWVSKQIGTHDYKVCEGYNYVADVTTLYKVTSDWAYTNEYYKGYNPPKDTMTSRWILQDAKVDYCEGTCTNHIYFVYRQQVRSISKTTEVSNVSATCTSIRNVSVPIYGEVPEVKTYTTKEPLYGYKKFYRDRTRTITQNANTVYTWGAYNDSTLLSQGWIATGERREK